MRKMKTVALDSPQGRQEATVCAAPAATREKVEMLPQTPQHPLGGNWGLEKQGFSHHPRMCKSKCFLGGGVLFVCLSYCIR